MKWYRGQAAIERGYAAWTKWIPPMVWNPDWFDMKPMPPEIVIADRQWRVRDKEQAALNIERAESYSVRFRTLAA